MLLAKANIFMIVAAIISVVAPAALPKRQDSPVYVTCCIDCYINTDCQATFDGKIPCALIIIL